MAIEKTYPWDKPHGQLKCTVCKAEVYDSPGHTPKHTLEDCFETLINRIELLEDQVERLYCNGKEY